MAELIAIIGKSTLGLTSRAGDLLLKKVTLEQASASRTEQRETAAGSEGPHPPTHVYLRLISAIARGTYYGSHSLLLSPTIAKN
jgi:hypothetical protein